jgi:hypothetical protein
MRFWRKTIYLRRRLRKTTGRGRSRVRSFAQREEDPRLHRGETFSTFAIPFSCFRDLGLFCLGSRNSQLIDTICSNCMTKEDQKVISACSPRRLEGSADTGHPACAPRSSQSADRNRYWLQDIVRFARNDLGLDVSLCLSQDQGPEKLH